MNLHYTEIDSIIYNVIIKVIMMRCSIKIITIIIFAILFHFLVTDNPLFRGFGVKIL